MPEFGLKGKLNEVCCPLCSNPSRSALIFRDGDGIGYWKCRDCRLMYASPRPGEGALLEIYENPDFFAASFERERTYEEWRSSGSRAYLHARVKIDFVRRHLGEGQRLLDVGCGHGLTLAEGERRGLDCEGIDPSGMLTRHARERFGAQAIQTTIDRFDPGYRFAGVLVWDVLEHVPDPAVILEHAHRLLEGGGWIFVQVPNHRGLSNRWKSFLCRIGLRRKYSHFGYPWHIYSYDRHSLNLLLSLAGFRVTRIESWSALVKDARNRLPQRPFNELIRRRCWGDYVVAAAVKE